MTQPDAIQLATKLVVSDDPEEFVLTLATSLVCLVVKWRERAATYPATWPVPGTSGADRLAYATAADELEAALRQATQ